MCYFVYIFVFFIILYFLLFLYYVCTTLTTCHWKRPWCWERLRAGEDRGWRRMRWLDDTTDSVGMSLRKLQATAKDSEVWLAAVQGVRVEHDSVTEQEYFWDWKLIKTLIKAVVAIKLKKNKVWPLVIKVSFVSFSLIAISQNIWRKKKWCLFIRQ